MSTTFILILAPFLAQNQVPQDTTANRAVRNPATEYRAYQPLTQGQRARHYVAGLFSPISFFRAGAGAAITQAMNTPGEWGQGGIGYGRRVASS